MVTSKAMNSNAAAASAASSNVNNGTDSDTKFDPYALGVQFVRQYYTMLNEDPQNLFRFYGRESYMVHGNGTDRCDPIKGQDAIKKKILSLNYKDCRTKIDSVDSLESSLDNVVIQVVGQLSNNRQPMRRFFQTFVLCRRNTNHYFVKNDIFRFQEYDYPEEEDYFENELNNSQASAVENNQSESASINELQINSLSVSSNNDVQSNNLSASNITTKNSINNNSANNIHLEEVSQLNSSNTSNMINSAILSGSTNGNASLEALQVPEPTPTVIEQLASNLINQNEMPVNTAVNSLKTNQDLFYNHEPVEEKTTIENSNIFNQNLMESKAEAIRNTVSTYANMVLRSSKNQPSNYSINESIQINKSKPTNVSSNLTNATNNTNHNNNNNNASNEFNSSGDNFGTISKESQGSFNKIESKNNGGSSFFDTFNSNNDNTFGSHFNSHKKEANSHSDGQQIFIGHLDQSISEDQLNNFFSQYGSVLEVNINRSNQRQGKALNFGFVIFEQSDSVQKVLASKPIIINGQRINVEEKRAPNGRGNGNNNGFGRFNANNRNSYATNGNGHSGQFNTFSSRNHQRDGPRNERNNDRNNDRSDRNGLKRKSFNNSTANATRINSNAFNRQ